MGYTNKDAEQMRIRYLYRRLIRHEKLHLGVKDAAALVGPDTAYHLYQNRDKKDDAESR